jgi:hypothetical protein
MATQRIVQINTLRLKMKVLGDLANNINALTITNGVADVPELKVPKLFSNDLLINYANFAQKAGKLFDKADYDETDAFYEELQDTLTSMISKASNVSNRLVEIGNVANLINQDPSNTSYQTQYDELIYSLHDQYDVSQNIMSYKGTDFNIINVDASGSYPVPGQVLDPSGNFKVDYYVSPNQTTELDGYRKAKTTATVNNAGVNLVTANDGTGYPATGADVAGLNSEEFSDFENFNSQNKTNVDNFVSDVAVAKDVLISNKNINQADRDNNASLYESAKNAFVNDIQNELNEAELKLNLLAYSQDNKFIIPFLGTVNGAN